MIILLPDGTVSRTGRRNGRMSARIAAWLIPLGGIFATMVVGLLGL